MSTEITNNRSSKWLVAGWPGMGNVAVVAASYLVQKLGFEVAAELPSEGRFDISAVGVGDGLITTPRMPRGLFFRHPNPAPGRDFTIFLGEAQPSHDTFAFARQLLDSAQQFGVERVVTFASMATDAHPAQPSRVVGAVTSPAMLDELLRAEIKKLEAGQIAGLNGVLLGAAAERGIPGMCLMGEIPMFAAGVPNAKAAMAVLGAFSSMSGIEIDLKDLEGHAKAVEKALVALLKKLQEQHGLVDGETVEDEQATEDAEPAAADDHATDPSSRPLISEQEQANLDRIETLFEAARKDPAKVGELKAELDRLRMFRRFENRFLDLFKRAA